MRTNRRAMLPACLQLRRRWPHQVGSKSKPTKVKLRAEIQCVTIKKRPTAIVCIPVRDVTVADPPRISMEDTMMLVANLRDSSVNENTLNVKLIHTQRTWTQDEPLFPIEQQQFQAMYAHKVHSTWASLQAITEPLITTPISRTKVGKCLTALSHKDFTNLAFNGLKLNIREWFEDQDFAGLFRLVTRVSKYE